MSKTQEFKNGVLIYEFDGRTLLEAKNERLATMRAIASQAISDAGIDQVTQQNAALGLYEAERVSEIVAYIASCRTEYLRCKQLISDSTTNDEVDAVAFVVPEVVEIPLTYTAAEWVDQQKFDGNRPTTLLYLKLQLDAASKTSPKLAAVQGWLDQMILAGVTAPDERRSDWSAAPYLFEEASQEALAVLAG